MGIREDLHALVERIASELERNTADGWLDQDHSPLGREKHLALARAGKLPARKEGKQVFVRRSDIDAYIDRHPVIAKVDPEADEQREADRIVASLGRRKRSA